jgi:hypothetical protein
VTPGNWGAYVSGALPYAAAEALRIAAWITVPFAVLIAVAFMVRHRRALAGLMDRGDGQGGVPGLARRERDLPRLARAIGNVERRTQAMSAAELDAVSGSKLGELVSQDRVITEQWRAAFDEMTYALRPRMVAPTRADLAAIDAVQVNGGRNGNLGDLDPDPNLGERR